MNNDLGELLQKVAVPVKELSKTSEVFNFRQKNFNFLNYTQKKYQPKFIKIGILVILAVAIVWFFAGQRQDQAIKIQSVENTKPVSSFVAEISKFIILPEENPIIVTVAKIELLKDNLFFVDAKNGDKVLLFEKANKAILYDPIVNKIINTGTVAETGIKL